MDKKILRKLMNEQRKTLTDNMKFNLDNKIFEKVINSTYYKNSKTIFIFVSYNNEVDTHRIITHALEHNKIVTIPKVISKKDGMISVQIKSFDDLESGTYGILEPKSYCATIEPKTIDFVLVPGLAFDKNGGRLGYGGGYYDRFLSSVPSASYKLGIAYNFQIVQEVPMEPTDIKINGLITDKENYMFL